MTFELLVKSASRIKLAPINAVEEYAQKKDILVAEINRKMLQRPDINDLVGEKNLEMMKDNHSNHARFIESILKEFNSSMLVLTVLWVFRAYRSRGFHYNYWAAQINTWIEILKKELTPESYQAVYPIYEWLSINIPIFSELSAAQIESQKIGHCEKSQSERLSINLLGTGVILGKSPKGFASTSKVHP